MPRFAALRLAAYGQRIYIEMLDNYRVFARVHAQNAALAAGENVVTLASGKVFAVSKRHRQTLPLDTPAVPVVQFTSLVGTELQELQDLAKRALWPSEDELIEEEDAQNAVDASGNGEPGDDDRSGVLSPLDLSVTDPATSPAARGGLTRVVSGAGAGSRHRRRGRSHALVQNSGACVGTEQRNALNSGALKAPQKIETARLKAALKATQRKMQKPQKGQGRPPKAY